MRYRKEKCKPKHAFIKEVIDSSIFYSLINFTLCGIITAFHIIPANHLGQRSLQFFLSYVYGGTVIVILYTLSLLLFFCNIFFKTIHYTVDIWTKGALSLQIWIFFVLILFSSLLTSECYSLLFYSHEVGSVFLRSRADTFSLIGTGVPFSPEQLATLRAYIILLFLLPAMLWFALYAISRNGRSIFSLNRNRFIPCYALFTTIQFFAALIYLYFTKSSGMQFFILNERIAENYLTFAGINTFSLLLVALVSVLPCAVFLIHRAKWLFVNKKRGIVDNL